MYVEGARFSTRALKILIDVKTWSHCTVIYENLQLLKMMARKIGDIVRNYDYYNFGSDTHQSSTSQRKRKKTNELKYPEVDRN